MIDSWDLDPATVGWATAGLLILLVVGYVLYSFLGAILLGLFLYYATRPVYRWLDERFGYPDVNAFLTLLTVGLPILFILGYASLVAISELDQLLDQANLEQLRGLIRPYVDLASLTDPQEILGRFSGSVPELVSILGAAFTWTIRIFVAITVAFYLLRDDRKIADWLGNSFHREYGVVSFLEGVDDDLTTIYTGNLITIGATGLIATIVYYGFSLFAPPSVDVVAPILLGLLTGVATLIPAVGIKIIYVPYVAFLTYQAVTANAPLWYPAVFLVVIVLIVDSFPDIVIRSYVSKGEINMGLIMLSYVLGAMTFGWYGVFLAPVVLVVFLHFAHRVLPNLLDPADTRLVTDDWHD